MAELTLKMFTSYSRLTQGGTFLLPSELQLVNVFDAQWLFLPHSAVWNATNFSRNSKFQPSTCTNVIYVGNVTRLQHHRWCNAELPNAGMLQPHVKNSSQSQFLILAFTWSTPCQYPNARDLKRQSAAIMKVSHLISWCVVHCKGHGRVKQNASSHSP